MQRLIGFVLDKFGELGPVRRLFKFFFGRVFDNFIDREIKLSDFKNNILELENLPLSASKVNKAYLADAPYRLHSGTIGKLRIKIASFKELTTKDLEVSIDNIHLVFKFNSNYHRSARSFTSANQPNLSLAHLDSNTNPSTNLTDKDIDEIDLADEDDEEFDEGEKGDRKKKGKQDMYKQFIRQVLSNIKLSINDLIIDVFMNEPTKTSRPQAFASLSLKRLKVYQQKKEVVHKKLRIIKEKSENLYWIKLKEISVHILTQKEEENRQKKEDPWKRQLSINSPSCILACCFQLKSSRAAEVEARNKSKDPQQQQQQKKDQQNLHQSYFFDYNQSMIVRDVRQENADDEAFLPHHLQIECLLNPNEAVVKSLKVYLPAVEIMLDPVQLKVLRNFTEQIDSFTKIRQLNEYQRNTFSHKDLRHHHSNQMNSPLQSLPQITDQSQNQSLHQNNAIRIINPQSNMSNDNNNSKLLVNDYFKIPTNEPYQQQRQQQEEEQLSPIEFKSETSAVSSETDFVNDLEFDLEKTQFDLKVVALNIYLLKAVNPTVQTLPRSWIYYYNQTQQSLDTNSNIVEPLSTTSYNQGIPQNYFMVSLKTVTITTQSKSKKTLAFSSLKVIDVNLVQNRGILDDIRLPNEKSQPKPSNSRISGSSSLEQSQTTNIHNMFQQSMEINKSIRGSAYRGSILNQSQKNSNQNDEDEDLFMSIDNNQFFQSNNLYLQRQQSTGLHKIEEEIEQKSIKQQQLNLEKEQKSVASPVEEEWKINDATEHYCLSYILKLKPIRKQPKANPKQSTNPATVFKNQILINSHWSQEQERSEPNQSDQAFFVEFIKSGSNLIQIDAKISEMYLSIDQRVETELYYIAFPCESWNLFTRSHLASDLKLVSNENIEKLEEYQKSAESISEYFANKLASQIPIKDEQIRYSVNAEFSRIKIVAFSIVDRLNLKRTLHVMEYGINASTLYGDESDEFESCICSHFIRGATKYRRFERDQLGIEIKGLQVTLSQETQLINANMQSINAGIMRFSKNISLNSSQPALKFYELATLSKIELTKNLGFNSHQNLDVKLSSIDLNVWNVKQITQLAASISKFAEKNQTLLSALKKFTKESLRMEKLSLMERGKSSEEVRSIDGSDEEEQKQFYIPEEFSRSKQQTHINEKTLSAMNQFQASFNSSLHGGSDPFAQSLDIQLSLEYLTIKIIYRKAYKQQCSAIKSSSHLSQNSSIGSEKLSEYLRTMTLYPEAGKFSQAYDVISKRKLPLNFSLELVISSAQISLEKQFKDFSLSIQDILLVDHQQIRVCLANYRKNTTEETTYRNFESYLPNLPNRRGFADYKILIYSSSLLSNQISISKNKEDLIESLPHVLSRIKKQPIFKISGSYCTENITKQIQPETKNTRPNLNQPKPQNIQSDQNVESDEEIEEQAPVFTIVPRTTINISQAKIERLRIRFGNFSSDIMDNILDLTSTEEDDLSNPKKEDHNQKKQNQQNSSNSEEKVLPPSEIKISVNNFIIDSLLIDLFPIHDAQIRRQLPSVYKNISKENTNTSFYCNQRSVVSINGFSLSRLLIEDSGIEFEMQLSRFDLFTLMFEDYLKTLNPLLLVRDYSSNEETFEALGFSQILEIGCTIMYSQRDKGKLQIDIQKFQLNTCKDTIQGLPLHITLISLLASRMTKPSSSQTQKMLSQIQIQNEKKLAGLSILQHENVNLQDNQQENDQENEDFHDDDEDNDDLGFIEIDDDFLADLEKEDKTNDRLKAIFVKDAKDQNLQYFHQQTKGAGGSLNFNVDFKVKSIEIQIFSGKDFDFALYRAPPDESHSSSKIQQLDSQFRPIALVLPARKRNSHRSYDNNLLLAFDQIVFLYSQFDSLQKINLSIQSIDFIGTASSKSSTILRKKDKLTQMLVIDIELAQQTRVIEAKVHFAGVKIVVDSSHLKLFELLSKMDIDMVQVETEVLNDDAAAFNNQIEESNGSALNDSDDFEIFEGNSKIVSDPALGYRIQWLYVTPLEAEISVNWVVSSLVKDSKLKFDEFFKYSPTREGIPLDGVFISQIIKHYADLVTKNNQHLKILTDVVLIRNFTNLTKGFMNLIILPYNSFKKDGKISSGLVDGVKGLKNSLFQETQNFFSLASTVYNSCALT